MRDLGRADYVPTWRAMQAFTEARGPQTPDELWVAEHPPVFTLGQAARREHLLAPGEIPVIATDRGGQVTYHGPGQVVIYPLLDLRRLGIFVKELVYRIEQAVIQTLDAYAVEGRRVPGAPGIYVPFPAAACGRSPTSEASGLPTTRSRPGSADDRRPTPDTPFAGLAKIAAIGIKVTRGCSYHGVALNVAMDLAPFERIDPCGYAGLRTVDLATLGVHVSPAQVAGRLSERLSAHLSR